MIAGCKAGIAVDAENRVIVAHAVQTVEALLRPSDFAALIPLVDAIRAYMASGCACHGDGHEGGHRRFTRCPRMAATIRHAGPRSRHRLRKQTAEPVLGQIEEAGGSLRGLEKVRAEWAMFRTAHNLLKLARAAR